MTKAVVTGGAGFIGSHIVDRLAEMGMDVVVLDDLATGDTKNTNSRARFVNGSVCDPGVVQATLEGAEYVFHTAALPRIQPSFDDPLGHDEVNVRGTIHCLEALKDSPHLKKFVFCSSSACYGTPEELPTPETARISCLSPYALQKYVAEQYSLILGERFDIPVVALRYFNVYGPRSFNPLNPLSAYSSVLGIFKNQFENGKTLTVTGDGLQSRDFVHVFDVVEANLAAALSGVTQNVFNVGCGQSYTIIETAQLFSEDYVFIPERKGEARITLAAIDKIKESLGWSPKISLKKGVTLLGD